MTVITITVRPLGRGRFSACLNERVLVESSRTPLFCATRVLVLLRKNGELLMKQEDLHAEDPFYERVSG